MLVVLMGRISDHLTLEDYLTTDLVDTWLRNMKTRYSSPVALLQLSLSFPVGTPNSILCLPCPTVGSLMTGAAFVLFSTLSASIAMRGSLFTQPVLIKALPLVRHCDACTMPALLVRGGPGPGLGVNNEGLLTGSSELSSSKLSRCPVLNIPALQIALGLGGC